MTARFGGAARRGVLVALALATLLGAGGCSSVPDAANPVEWYRGTRDWIAGDDRIEPARQAAAKPVPGAEKPFPNLSSVPERPAATPERDRREMARTLAADRDAARYTDEQFRRQTADVTDSPLSTPPPAPDSPAAAPARAEAPATPPPVPEIPAVPPVSPPPAASPQTEPQAAAPTPGTARSTAPPPRPPVPHQPVPVDVQSVEPAAGQAASLPENPPRAVSPPPDIPSAVAAGQPVPVDPAPYSAPAPPPQTSGAVSGGRTAFASPNRFSTRFPPGAGTIQGPRTLNPPSPAAGPGFSQEPQPDPFAGAPADGVATGGAPVATVFFNVGSSKVGPRGRRAVREAFRAYQATGGRIRIVGHASSRTRNLDRVSHELANFRVSDERARAVARELIRLGVDPTSILVEAVSDHQPAYLEVMPAGEAGNRRAEILLEN